MTPMRYDWLSLNRSTQCNVTQLALLVAVFVTQYATAYGEAPYSTQWLRQIGTAGTDESRGGIAADGLGNVYVSGFVADSIGPPHGQFIDAFIRKYTVNGNVTWTRQYGPVLGEISTGVSVDGLGNVYMAGSQYANASAPLDYDAFLVKYNALGNQAWAQQLGLPGDQDLCTAVSANSLGSIFIAGHTEGSLEGTSAGGIDAFVSKYDSAGNHLWTRQLGTSDYDDARGVATDGLGNVYVSGTTFGSIDGQGSGLLGDGYISKFDGAGNQLWTRQIGTFFYEEGNKVAVDALGNAYLTGYTRLSLDGPNAGLADAFLTKYDPAGTLLWTRQLGTAVWDEGVGVSLDGLGNVYISGRTDGTFDVTYGMSDGFVSKYDVNGNHLWSRNLGGSSNDNSTNLSADSLRNVFVAGSTSGAVGGPSYGDTDVWLARLVPQIPEPSSFLLAAIGAVLFAPVRRR